MITTLHIQNIGIIEDLTIDFNQGFNVMTGETGAGKTLIIDSLAIIAGGRFSKEMMRKQTEYSFVEACFYLPKHEKAVDGNIIISREIYATGRNLCKINGRLVTVTELKSFMNEIIDIHGQNENQSLLEPAKQMYYLDNFTGKHLHEIKQEYTKLYEKYKKIKQELMQNYGDEKEKQRKLDLLDYQVKEIIQADLKIGEDEELEAQRKVMINSEKLADNLLQADNQIGGITLDAINQAIRNLEKIEKIDSKFKETLGNLKSSYYDLQEVARDIEDFKEEITFDPSQQERVESRLDSIDSLKRKYGNTIKEILEYKQQVEQEIEIIQNLESLNNERKEQLGKLEKQMTELANQMHEIRMQKGEVLSERVNQELKDLEMKQAKFMLKIQKEEQFQKEGLDHIEFYIATNMGEEAKPLTKIASGGEMSRIMLAIKTVLAKVDEIPVLIFDEIDTGISGAAAKMVGEKLKEIAISHQVLVITHQASIAAKGDYNYLIHKVVMNGKTQTKIELLQEEQVVMEIARIASGDITKIAIEHARELREVV